MDGHHDRPKLLMFIAGISVAVVLVHVMIAVIRNGSPREVEAGRARATESEIRVSCPSPESTPFRWNDGSSGANSNEISSLCVYR